MSNCVTIELTIKVGTYTAEYKGGTAENGKFKVGAKTDCVCFATNEDCIVHFANPNFFAPPTAKIDLKEGVPSPCLTILGNGSTKWRVKQTIAMNQKYDRAKLGSAPMKTTITAADSSVAVMVKDPAEIELIGKPDEIIRP